MTLRFNEVKTTQAAARLLFSNGGHMEVLKLVKLLYLADRKALLRWGRPLTFDRYFSLPHGPVLGVTVDRINEPVAPEGLPTGRQSSRSAKATRCTFSARSRPETTCRRRRRGCWTSSTKSSAESGCRERGSGSSIRLDPATREECASSHGVPKCPLWPRDSPWATLWKSNRRWRQSRSLRDASARDHARCRPGHTASDGRSVFDRGVFSSKEAHQGDPAGHVT